MNLENLEIAKEIQQELINYKTFLNDANTNNIFWITNHKNSLYDKPSDNINFVIPINIFDKIKDEIIIEIARLEKEFRDL
jgi:hypothetical protein